MARQKRTLKALGLKKMHYTVEVEATPQILGMVKAVHHLVEVTEEVNGGYQLMTPLSLQAGLNSFNTK